jgi:hydroxymethylpyrimidine pyrophosphatase-like HAD family hydrolase/adenine/guanine phosphoribosyltransferase-like PRPP-binding protein
VSKASCETVDNPVSRSEHDFYERYAWCLNPLQSLDQLFARLSDELEWYPHLEIEWQRQESRINFFLLSCAISCTVSDYLAPSLPSFSKLAARWQSARFALRFAGAASTTVHRLHNSLLDRAVGCWQQEWTHCVELSCEILLGRCEASSPQVARLTTMSYELAGCVLPEKVRRARMQIPSGFRAQDLTHYDVIALADAFDSAHSVRTGALAIVGARTAGIYFAPLLHARLQQLGWKSSWMSVRPKSGLSHWEIKSIRAVASASKVIIVDDHPDTGETIRLMINLLGDYGIDRRKITVVVPSHDAQREKSVLTGGYADVELVTLLPQDSYKHRLLDGDSLMPLLEQFASAENPGAVLIDDKQTRSINQRLETHLRDDYQVHVKRVYAFRVPGVGGKIQRILAKSVGWGWLGYHAYLAGTRLHDFVPQVFGLQDGMLFSEWIETKARPEQPRADCKHVARIAAYIAARVKLLSIEDDSAIQPASSVSGWYTLVKVMRGIYPPHLRWLKMHALWNDLGSRATPQPTFIDGKLGPEEWLSDGERLLKIDYEHHGFGNPSPNIADAAYDLALATLQLNLSPEAERCLLDEYVRLTGDHGVRERIVLFALVSGHLAAETAYFHSFRAHTHESRKQFEALHIDARNFLTYSMVRFCSEQFVQPRPVHWSNNLFFMDLDGVFDRSRFYFPHTTASGMAAVASLNSSGYSVVLNTGRPVAHVRRYCSSYAFAGGIAEYGCVFVDHIHQREILLIDEESREKLDLLRERWTRQSGIFLDPTYEFAIRAYQIQERHSVCLPQAFVDEALREFPQLTFLSSPLDTYIFPVDAGKGSATKQVMEQLSVPHERTAAIGDSEFDLPMLDSVAKAYVPANASEAMLHDPLRRYTVMSAPFQRGLVQAVEHLTANPQSTAELLSRPVHATPEHILRTLLRVGDRTTLEHWMAVLRYKQL